MKTNRMFAIGLSAILACSAMPAAFAAEVPAETTKPVSGAPLAEQNATLPSAADFRLAGLVTVKQPISAETDVHGALLVETEEGQQLQLNIGAQTLCVDDETGLAASLADIKAGDKIYAYYSAAMTRSLPPQSACELILVNVGDKVSASLHEVGSVTKEADGKLAVLNAAGDMIIRMDDKTNFQPYATKQIVKADDLTEGTRFLAWYDIVALSYPGQAYTERVVILPAADAAVETEDAAGETEQTAKASEGEADKAETIKIAANGKELDVTGTLQGDVAIVPVRAVAEALGCKISYEQKDGKEFVTVENDTRKMVLEIGVDNYVSETKIEDAVGMTAPAQLGVVPVVLEGTTYAPAELFRVLVGYDVVMANGTVMITAQA